MSHEDVVQRRLPDAWQLPVVMATAAPFGAELDELEVVVTAWTEMSDVRTATGVWLDRLGALVGQPRGAFSDDDEYRAAIIARGRANVSRGEPDALYGVLFALEGAGLVTVDAVYPYGPGSVRVEVTTVLPADLVAGFVGAVVPAGCSSMAVLATASEELMLRSTLSPAPVYQDGCLSSTAYSVGGYLGHAGEA